MTFGLLAAVEAAYRADPLSKTQWDDPYPQRLLPGEDWAPPEDAYSRVSEPEKYRIVGARARAWERALERLGLGDAGLATAPTTGPTAALNAVPTAWTFQPEQPQVRLIVPRCSWGGSRTAAATPAIPAPQICWRLSTH
ncbi:MULTISPECIES: DUF6226 family protein [Actinomycetes]|uniref:Uncharacterized protein n=2 Tax=Actinomycetes TaxID=1760 RepID=A0ABP6LTT7_9MICC